MLKVNLFLIVFENIENLYFSGNQIVDNEDEIHPSITLYHYIYLIYILLIYL